MRLSTRGGVGSKPLARLELEARQLEHPDLAAARSRIDRLPRRASSSSVGPMLPATATRLAARSTSRPVSAVDRGLAVGAGDGEHLGRVAVLVASAAASACGEQARARRRPACLACARRASSGAMRSSRGARPGLRQHAARRRRAAPASNAPPMKLAPAARARAAPRSLRRLGARVARRARARRCARTSAPSPGRIRRGRARARAGLRGVHASPQLQRGQADQAQQHRDDPEAHDDLRLLPAALLEVVVQRRHPEECAGPRRTSCVYLN